LLELRKQGRKRTGAKRGISERLLENQNLARVEGAIEQVATQEETDVYRVEVVAGRPST
jgi:hypothetical protein